MNLQEHPMHDGDSGTPGAPSQLRLDPGSGQNEDTPGTSSGATSAALRQIATLATNVAILTALLVYFGWRRTETQAARLGVDETIFGLSTRDYLLRSVGPVLQILAIVAVAGLVAVYLDRALWRRAQGHGLADRTLRIALFGMSISWLILPMLIIGLGYIAPAAAFVAFPLAIAGGVLLLMYAGRLRRELQGHDQKSTRWRSAEKAFAIVALCVTAFWATSNYADVLGTQVADATINHVSELTSVTVYAVQRLGISGPGTHETPVTGAGETYRYRYTGLRLLEHTGDKYFLIPNLWNPDTGEIMMLKDSSSLRFEFGADAAK
jgi:hypothetical protein